jgi:5-methylcytosine-specific restriction endonuclease McrA
MDAVVVLNYDYQYINKISWKKAVCLVYKGKAEVLKESRRLIRNAEKTVEIMVPKVLRLLKLVRVIYKQKVPFSKKNVLVRDNYTCQYCGTNKVKLTIDHIVPRSRGGKTTFENCVAACRECNSRKGNKTPREAKMFPRSRPTEPTIMEFLRLQMKRERVDLFLKELGVY